MSRLCSRLRAGAGLVLGLLLILPDVAAPAVAAAPDPGPVVITELLYAPSVSTNEVIELYNRSGEPVDLSTLAFADETRAFTPVAASSVVLPPDSHAVLVRDSAAFRQRFPDVEVLVPSDWAALNNGGDTVVLRRRSTETVLDAVPYEPSWGGAEGRSLERIDPAGPGDAASNFGSSTAPAGATPGRRNSLYDPDETPPRPVFAEMTGPARTEVTFSEPLPRSTIRPAAFRVGSTRIEAAVPVRERTVALTLAAPPSAPTLRVSGVRDRVGNRLETATLPLAYRPAPDDILLNEILYAPRADDFDDRPNQVEYVEVRNRSDRPRTLNGLFLTDRPDETGVADTLRLGRRVALRPHGYGVLAAAPDDAASPAASQLAAAFPDAPLGADSVAVLLADAARLGLTNDGGLIRLHRADGRPVAEVRYRPDWHAAELEETAGTALERISATADAQSADNWTSSPAPAGGTPGTRNAVGLPPPEDAAGTRLRVAPSPFSIERDGATRIRYTLETAPSLVRARIYDARGRAVRTLEDARLSGRTGELVWNGRDDAGRRVRVGVYVVLLEAVRADAGTVTRLKAPVVVARPLD